VMIRLIRALLTSYLPARVVYEAPVANQSSMTANLLRPSTAKR
jgi:hypothetical protein